MNEDQLIKNIVDQYKEQERKEHTNLVTFSRMMSTMSDLVPYQQSKYADDETFGAIATSVGFLPRLQLFGSNSDAVKRGTFPID